MGALRLARRADLGTPGDHRGLALVMPRGKLESGRTRTKSPRHGNGRCQRWRTKMAYRIPAYFGALAGSRMVALTEPVDFAKHFSYRERRLGLLNKKTHA